MIKALRGEGITDSSLLFSFATKTVTTNFSLFLFFLHLSRNNLTMKLFRLTGNTSTIKLSLEHPILLDKDENNSAGLAGFYSDNFVTNINQELTDSFRFHQNDCGKTFSIIPEYYSIKTLEKGFNECLLQVYLSALNDPNMKTILV